MSGVPLLDPPSSPLPLSWWRRLKDKSLSRRGSFARSFPRLHSGRLEKRSRFSGTYNTRREWDNAPNDPKLLDPSPASVSTRVFSKHEPPSDSRLTVPIFVAPPRSTFVQSARLLSAFSAAILNRDLIPPPLREKLISIRVKIFVTKLFYHFYCEKYDVNFSVKKFSYSRIFRILFNKTLLHLIEKSFEIRFDEICSKDHESEKRD